MVMMSFQRESYRRNTCAVVLAALLGCSAHDRGDEPIAQAQSAVTSTSFTVQIASPYNIPLLSAVITGSNSVVVADRAKLVRQTTGGAEIVSTGLGGVRVAPDAIANDIWSRAEVTLGDRVTVTGSVHAPTLARGNQTVLTGVLDTATGVDPLTELRWLVTYPSSAASTILLDGGKSLSLAPGRYGLLRVADRSHLTLRSGIYYLSDLQIESGAQVVLDQQSGPVIIYTTNVLQLRGVFKPTDSEKPDIVLVDLGSNAVNVEAPFSGAIIAPSATLTLRQVAGVHEGTFFGKDVKVDPSAEVRHRAIPSVLVVGAAPLQLCTNTVPVRSDLAGRARELAYAEDLARYCRMPSTDLCTRRLYARANTDYTAAALQLINGLMTPAEYLSSVRDRTRKLRAAEDNATTRAAYCSPSDADGDGIPDPIDACPNTPSLKATDDRGCPVTSLPDAPSAADVKAVLSRSSYVMNPNCRSATIAPEVSAGAFYRPADPNQGTYILAGRVRNQFPSCAVWYLFDIQELDEFGLLVSDYSVAFKDTEAASNLVGSSNAVPANYIQFNPTPVDTGTRRQLGTAGGRTTVRFRVQAMNANGIKGPVSAWKITDPSDCLLLGFRCQ